MEPSEFKQDYEWQCHGSINFNVGTGLTKQCIRIMDRKYFQGQAYVANIKS